MPSVVAAVLLGLLGADVAADAVTLRDGKLVIGEVIEPAPRGALWLNVRRAWAREHLPEWADRWEAAERPTSRRAIAQRRDRLAAWRRDRDGDAVAAWIDRELERLKDEGAAASPLLVVKLARADVRAVARAPRGRTRLLRLAWTSRLPDPEGMSPADLKDALEGRGLDASATDPVPLDALQPLPLESDAAWQVRRAATEVTVDPGLRFVRHQGLVFPEPAPGQPLNAGLALTALGSLKDLLDDRPTDPVGDRLRAVAARRRVGALVTQLDVAPDLSWVSVEVRLWVRQGDRWSPAGSRAVRVRPGDLGPDAGKDLADDPQVASAFQLVEAIGLGGVPPEVKQRSLNAGAATRKALGQARTAAQADLAALALPVLANPDR